MFRPGDRAVLRSGRRVSLEPDDVTCAARGTVSPIVKPTIKHVPAIRGILKRLTRFIRSGYHQ